MSGVLNIRDTKTGNFVPITAIRGEQGPQGPQGPKGDGIGVITSTIYPNENFLYPIPSPVTKENLISIVWQSWAKSGGPATCIFAPTTLGGVYGFDAVGFSASSSGGTLSPYRYNDDTTKGVTVKIYYNLG